MKFSKNINLLLFVFLFPASVFSQVNDTLKNEAMNFSMSIIQTYFTEDCESLSQKFAPKIYSIVDEEFMVMNEELKHEICDAIKNAVSDKEKKYEDYLKEYKPRLLTKKEFEAEFGELEISDFDFLATDFFFFGNEVASPFTEEYIWDELEVLVIRKVDEGWLIVGGQ